MEIQIGNKIVDVTLISKEGNAVKIDVDGKLYDVDVAMLQNGTCSILCDGNSYNAEMVKTQNGKHYRVNVNYSTYEIDMLDSQAKYMRMRKQRDTQEQNDVIAAPMPCKIVKVYCKAGDALKAGDTVLTMEAMKIQSNYKVSADCRVRSVEVSEGDNVRVDQTLVTLDLNENTNE